MKKQITLFTIVLFSFCAIQVNAQTRVLTSEEKAELVNDATFKKLCEEAVFDYAAYWSIHDGSGMSTESDRIRWAKDKLLGVHVLKNGITDQSVTRKFVNAAKGKQFTLGAAPQPTATIVAAWIVGNTFDEFVGEYFKLQGDDINMSIGN